MSGGVYYYLYHYDDISYSKSGNPIKKLLLRIFGDGFFGMTNENNKPKLPKEIQSLPHMDELPSDRVTELMYKSMCSPRKDQYVCSLPPGVEVPKAQVWGYMTDVYACRDLHGNPLSNEIVYTLVSGNSQNQSHKE